MSGCEHTFRVHALHDGELSPAQAEELRRHVGVCGECAAELAACRASSSWVRAAPRPAVPTGLAESIRRRIDTHADGGVFRLGWWLTSAAAMILVGCVLRLEFGHASTMTTPTPAWDLSASYAGMDGGSGATSDERQFAQWVVDDLSHRPQ